jgi:hypothetical protein
VSARGANATPPARKPHPSCLPSSPRARATSKSRRSPTWATSTSPRRSATLSKPKGGLTEAQTTYNKLIRGVHGVAERANALFKETFAVLQMVSLSPTGIGAITKATLVLLQLEHDRPLPGGYAK